MATETLSMVQCLHQSAATKPSCLDIIVPVYKNIALTERCLNSLAEHIHEIASREPRVIVINDSPGEAELHRMLEAFARRHSYVTVLANDTNQGFVRTANRGLAIAAKASRDAILVNADTETFEGTLKHILAAADSDPQIGFVSPRSNNASFCSLPHFHGGTLPDQAEARRRWERLSRTLPPYHFVPTAVGFYLYIKHAIIANFGFLDTAFGVGYEEENDLIFRANKVGYRAVLANNAFAYHAGSASFSLTDMNLRDHQDSNLKMMAQRHPEYLPLVRRYEGSAHFRAERLLGQTLASPAGRLKLLFDLSSVGSNFNGTNEMSLAIIEAFQARHASRFDVNVVCTPEAFKFHRLDRYSSVRRHDVDVQSAERFAIGVQLGQPFNVHSVSALEDLAVVNIFGMLDTIAEDCGHLSITHELQSVWGHAARHANGLFFNSRFSEREFLARYPDALSMPRFARLLPTKLSCYAKTSASCAAEHVLIMGNHFAHKASDATAEILRAAFPIVQFVVLGKQNRVTANVRAYRAGTLDQSQMESLYTRASVVVLPSYVEGFGLGLVHALAAGKPIVARDIPVTREILATYRRYDGVFLYANDNDVARALRLALNESGSNVDDHDAMSWNEWVDGFADFCAGLLEHDDVFARLVRRIQAGDLLRKAKLLDLMQSSSLAQTSPTIADSDLKGHERVLRDSRGRQWVPLRQIERLLALDGEEFIYSTYVTVLNRLPDTDGLTNYLSELESGISKLEVISRLRNSSEGRSVRMPLAGYRSMVLKTRLRALLGRPDRSVANTY